MHRGGKGVIGPLKDDSTLDPELFSSFLAKVASLELKNYALYYIFKEGGMNQSLCPPQGLSPTDSFFFQNS